MPTPIFNGLLAKTFTRGAYLGVAEKDQRVRDPDFKTELAFTVTGANRASASVYLPPLGRVTIWHGDEANTFPAFIRCGAGVVQLDPGAYLTVVTGDDSSIEGSDMGIAASAATAWVRVLPEDSPVVLIPGMHVDCDTRTGAIELDAPATLATFDEFFFSNLVASASTHAITVKRHAGATYTIDGLAADFVIDDDGAEGSLVYDGISDLRVR